MPYLLFMKKRQNMKYCPMLQVTGGPLWVKVNKLLVYSHLVNGPPKVLAVTVPVLYIDAWDIKSVGYKNKKIL